MEELQCSQQALLTVETEGGERARQSENAVQCHTDHPSSELIPCNFQTHENPARVVFNLRFGKRLRTLEIQGREVQYQFACLSTLGGAYHLCNHPWTAFILAKKQEALGRMIGSSSITLRAKVFQAVNFSLMGRSKTSRKIFGECRREAAKHSWTDMLGFVEASELWLAGQEQERKQQRLRSAQQESRGSVFLLEAGPPAMSGQDAAPATDQIGDQMQRCSIDI
ncbi:hypothetical protein B484DRAFT_268821 [Ochromonadaceae sp. CCMP2298]|nr:hypothetical protein B484DRAFT_268821 [Ochromonadaceae sp. CCMP2298]